MWWISLPHIVPFVMETNILVLKDQINKSVVEHEVGGFEATHLKETEALLCFAKGKMEMWKAIHLCACHVLVLSL